MYFRGFFGIQDKEAIMKSRILTALNDPFFRILSASK